MKGALVAALTVLLGLAVPGNAIAARTVPSNVAFTPPLGLAGGGAEPSIKNSGDAKEAAYVSAPAGTGSNFWYVDQVTNPDGSISFKGNLRKFDMGTGGGDSDITIGNAAGSSGCDPIAFSGLHNLDLLVNFTTSHSEDCGHGWASPNLLSVQNVGDDRQWMTFDGSKTVFLIFHKVDTSQIVVTQSLDGGATYTSFDPSGATGIIDPTTMASVFNTNQIGNLTVDYSQPIGGTYSNGEPIHALYAIFAGPRDPADNAAAQTDTSYNHNDTMYVAKSTDGGHTWADTKVYSTDPSGPNRELNMLFPVVTVDSAGTLYAGWSDGFKVQYAFSKDHGSTWSKAYQVNPDNRGTTPDAGQADVFPWLAAGSAGRLDVVWYHGAGGVTSQHRDPGDQNTQWTVAFAQLAHANVANTTGTPTPGVTVLDQDVSGLIHKGDVCQNGLNCDVLGGDRTLLDFFQVSIDKLGRANIAFASDATSPGNATVMYTRQNGGLSATSGKAVRTQTVVPLAVINGTSCPGPQVLDPYGDAYSSITVDPTGQNVDTYDIGSVTFTTPDATNIKVTLTIKDLSATPVPGTVSTLWAVYWSYNGTEYFVRATSNGPGVQTFDDGTYPGNFSHVANVSGTLTEGPNGTITWTVPRADAGLPATGQATITNPFADDHGAFTVEGNGLRYTAYVDRGPDTANGADYVVGGTC